MKHTTVGASVHRLRPKCFWTVQTSSCGAPGVAVEINSCSPAKSFTACSTTESPMNQSIGLIEVVGIPVRSAVALEHDKLKLRRQRDCPRTSINGISTLTLDSNGVATGIDFNHVNVCCIRDTGRQW